MSGALLGACVLACAGNGTSPQPEQQAVPQPVQQSGAPTGSPAVPAASAGDARGSGSLQVTVSWLDAPAEVRSLAGRNPCGQRYRPPVRVHTLGGVRDALVTVRALSADNRADAGPPAPSGPVELTVATCQVQPRVVLMGADGALALTNLDEMRHQVRLEAMPGSEGDVPVVDLPVVDLPIAGTRASVQLQKPGVFAARLAADGADPAYAVAPGPGRHRLTNGRGQARFAELAPGRYEVRVWHPPLAGKRPGTAATEQVTEQVTVRAGRAAEVTLSLRSLLGGG